MAKHRFPCSSCGRELEIDESVVRSAEKVKCPHCQSATGIPTDVVEDVRGAEAKRLAKEQKRDARLRAKRAKREARKKRQAAEEQSRRQREQVWKAEEGKRAEDRAEALRQEAERSDMEPTIKERLRELGSKKLGPPELLLMAVVMLLIGVFLCIAALLALVLVTSL